MERGGVPANVPELGGEFPVQVNQFALNRITAVAIIEQILEHSAQNPVMPPIIRLC